jgi:hypothetical protein
LALWWCEVFGVPPNPQDFPDDPEAICEPPNAGVRLLFERVPEGKSGKNRVHFDLYSLEGDAEVERLVGLGASIASDHRSSDGGGWVVLTDPAGNEFCIERGH